ncbi:M1 family metallopeptidase [Planktosalinus lacus]|uniref:Peptidase M1 n=1 Tax=Planktosalinus lacus TaxID=1526573 RepID=A0A8J2V837_9FLAO|nr:M1 family metallopeptidase [Planktosalinus lacus]GGD80397.1 peptidase M1 [Planktosalinus lacus]
MNFKYFSLLTLLIIFNSSAQNYHNYLDQFDRPHYWQQHVDYKMEIDVDVDKYQYKGKQEIVYTNNSPDTLKRVFYHLHFNAFQPGSEMDVRSRTISDPDRRVGDRISKLSPDEIGYIKINSLLQNGTPVQNNTVGTILEVDLSTPILPGEKATFTMDFDAQVPLQIRRSGRNNEEGVALSMSQWYPKLAEYDFEGWHADPYIGREFQGVWGNFDVKITIDNTYTLGGTGYLQNPNEIGHGYQDNLEKNVKHKNGKKLTWHFIAPDVHDFTWAADNEYLHDRIEGPNGMTLHFLYKNNPEIFENWKKLQPKTIALFEYFNKHLGDYPYKQYSIIQGGDGGMEYGMSTLITGERNFNSLVGVTAHEVAHSWFQFVLAFNESKHEWMDEGFTSYISALAMNEVMNQNKQFPYEGSYRSYLRMATSGKEQPQSTHADRYEENWVYNAASYSKGAVFLAQLEYLIGKENVAKTLKRFYDEFKFTHPTPNDFIRTAEKVSGFQLGWYLLDWTKTTNTIDYAIENVVEKDGKTMVTLERKGLMPMPIDFYVVYKDNTNESFHIPLRMMRGVKENPYPALKRTVLNDWAWAIPSYTFEIDAPLSTISALMIDASRLLADVNVENNVYEAEIAETPSEGDE